MITSAARLSASAAAAASAIIAIVIIIFDPIAVTYHVSGPVIVPTVFVIRRRTAIIAIIPHEAAGKAQGRKGKQHHH